jgi:hypothetical protein
MDAETAVFAFLRKCIHDLTVAILTNLCWIFLEKLMPMLTVSCGAVPPLSPPPQNKEDKCFF